MTVVVGAVVAAGGFLGVDVFFTGVEDGRGVELLPCEVVAPEPAVEPLAAGTGI